METFKGYKEDIHVPLNLDMCMNPLAQASPKRNP